MVSPVKGRHFLDCRWVVVPPECTHTHRYIYIYIIIYIYIYTVCYIDHIAALCAFYAQRKHRVTCFEVERSRSPESKVPQLPAFCFSALAEFFEPWTPRNPSSTEIKKNWSKRRGQKRNTKETPKVQRIEIGWWSWTSKLGIITYNYTMVHCLWQLTGVAPFADGLVQTKPLDLPSMLSVPTALQFCCPMWKTKTVDFIAGHGLGSHTRCRSKLGSIWL